MGQIKVVGLGPGAWQSLTVQGLETLLAAEVVYLRTEQHPVVEALRQKGVQFRSFDHLYEANSSFELIYQQIVDALFAAGTPSDPDLEIVFAVPGHPLVAERVVELLLAQSPQANHSVQIIPAMSGLEAVYTAIGWDPSRGLHIFDGLALSAVNLQPELATLILQVYNSRIAAEVKLTLMEVYPDEYPILVVRGAGIPGVEQIQEIPLYTLDRISWIDHLTSIFLPPKSAAKESFSVAETHSALYPLDPLVQVMERLLGPNGCPWDQEQTHASLRTYLMEETYEVLEALDDENMDKLADELGDLLFQIVFHAVLAQENEYFGINDVILKVTQKMQRRHPHVFGADQVDSADEVWVKWEQIKQQEGNEPKHYLAGIPLDMPALLRAHKVQAKAARIGFDWPNIIGVWTKVQEELTELREAVDQGSAENAAEELGDVLFSLVNLARFLHLDPEAALRQTIAKFIRRFTFMEEKANQEGKGLLQRTLPEMNAWWEEAKRQE